jgi:hypothetical protein
MNSPRQAEKQNVKQEWNSQKIVNQEWYSREVVKQEWISQTPIAQIVSGSTYGTLESYIRIVFVLYYYQAKIMLFSSL